MGQIHIRAGQSASTPASARSLIGDIASSAAKMDDGVGTPEEAPVLHVHIAYAKDFEKTFSGYKEVTAVEEIDTQIGPTRRNEFTAQSTFGSGLHGYRATALTRRQGSVRDVRLPGVRLENTAAGVRSRAAQFESAAWRNDWFQFRMSHAKAQDAKLGGRRFAMAN